MGITFKTLSHWKCLGAGRRVAHLRDLTVVVVTAVTG